MAKAVPLPQSQRPSLLARIVGAQTKLQTREAIEMTGRNVKQGVALQRQVRAVDVAPTLCYLLGMPMPQNVEGGVVYEALENMDWHLDT